VGEKVILDVFPFLDEVDLAELRIRYLAKSVDGFVVSEFDHGFSGEKKDFNFPKVISKLPIDLRTKVHYFPQSQKVMNSNLFENDRFQKDSIGKIMRDNFSSRDIIIFGDVDEIPDRTSLENINVKSSERFFFHFAQMNFLGFLNVVEETSLIHSYAGEFPNVTCSKWLGTILTSAINLLDFSVTQLRDPDRKKHSIRVNDGGWHFSFCGGENSTFEERFARKMKFSAHQEFNTNHVIREASINLKKGKDPFERTFIKRFGPVKLTRRPRFRVLSGLGHLPVELSDLCTYPHLVASK
jgi:beta-1,4-mannosyl-glycoprotein beta-1,4-N-acetylglucosaminyltransferase